MTAGDQEPCFGTTVGVEACLVTQANPAVLTELGRVCTGCLLVDRKDLKVKIGQLEQGNTQLEQANLVFERDALIDSVTQISNRRAYDKELLQRIEANEPFALLTIDLANFKQVNDRLTHDRGDFMLGITAEFLKNQLRDNDALTFRVGGDEFGVVLSNDKDADGGRTSDLSLAEKVEAVKERLASNFLNDESVAQYNERYKNVLGMGLHINGYIWEPGTGMSISELRQLADVDKGRRQPERIDLDSETSQEA